jgi:hypothetical protein
MMMESLTQRLGITAPAAPQTVSATGNVNSGSVDLQYFHRALFCLLTGTAGGTSPTLTTVLQIQESPDNSTWTNNATITATSVTPSTTGPQVATTEIRADQLGAGKRYVRLQAQNTVGGTSPTWPFAVFAFGDEANHKPGNVKNDASVIAQTVVN